MQHHRCCLHRFLSHCLLQCLSYHCLLCLPSCLHMSLYLCLFLLFLLLFLSLLWFRHLQVCFRLSRKVLPHCPQSPFHQCRYELSRKLHLSLQLLQPLFHLLCLPYLCLYILIPHWRAHQHSIPLKDLFLYLLQSCLH